MTYHQTSAVHVKRDGRRRSSWILAVPAAAALAIAPLVAHGQVVPSPTTATGNKPQIGSAGSKSVPLVQITTPSAAGVSRNAYDAFNVDGRGLILNNATSATTTQLAGMVAANPNLASSGSARIILNEVTGAGGSLLQGFTEVAGKSAEVVIANPNGITCNGCGFINASRGVLTTGTPVFGGTGSLDAFRVTGGNIAVEGAGLESKLSQVDLISRTATINAGIWANALNVVTGVNQVGYADLAAQALTVSGGSPAVSLDVGALGGMYAGKVRLVGTEKGVGVVSRGTLASSGEFTLSSDGDILLAGSTSSAGAMALSTNGNLDNQGTLYSGGTLGIWAGGALTNSSTLASGGDLAAVSASMRLGGTVAAGVTSDGQVSRASELSLAAAGAIDASGAQLMAGGDLSLEGASVVVAGAKVQSGGGTWLTARTGSVDNSGGSIQAGGNVIATAARNFDNTGGSVLGQGVLVTAGKWLANLHGGSIRSVGDTVLTVTSGDIDNTGGTIQAGGTLLATATGSRTYQRWTSADTAAQASAYETTDGRFENTGGTVLGTDVQITADTIHNQGEAGLIAAKNALVLVPRVLLVNEGGATIYSLGDIIIDGKTEGVAHPEVGGSSASAANVINSSARIEAVGSVSILAHDIINTKASFNSTPGTESAGPLPSGYAYPTLVETSSPGSAYGSYSYWYYSYDYYTVKPVITADSPQAQLLAGQDIVLISDGNGSIENRYSQVAAGRNQSVNFTVNLSAGVYVMRRGALCGSNSKHSDGTYGGGACWSTGTTVYPTDGEAGAQPYQPGTAPDTAAAPGDSAPTFEFKLPQTGLYHINTDPTAKYLVESDPRYLSTNYLLHLMGIDSEQVEKRLGDGFYEQQVVLDQITQLTGRRYLQGFSGSEGQFQALMDAGAAYAAQNGLKIGDALTDEQAAKLTTSMVWLVRQKVGGYVVLVPKLYLARDVARVSSQSGIISAGNDIYIDAPNGLANTGIIAADRNAIVQTSTLSNRGTITSGKVTSVSSTGNLAVDNRGGTLSSSGGLYLSSSGDLTLQGGKAVAGADLGVFSDKGIAATRTSLQAGGNLVANAGGGDLTLTTSSLTAGKSVALSATGSITSGATKREGIGPGLDVNQIQAGESVQAVAGKDLTMVGTQLTAGHDVFLQATGGNLSLLAAQDSRGQGYGHGGLTVGTSITAGGAIGLVANSAAGGDGDQSGNILVEGSTVHSSGGDVSLIADRDVMVRGARESWHAGTPADDSGLYPYSVVRNFGSTIGSDTGNVTIDAGRNLSLSGSQVNAGMDATLVARGGDLSITAVTDSVADERGGTWWGGSWHTKAYDETSKGSGITAKGNVTVAALSASDGTGGNVLLQGSTIQGDGVVTLYGEKDVSVTEAHEKHYSLSESTTHDSSLFGLVQTTTYTRDETSSDLVMGSLVSGGAVGIAAENDLLLQGSQVVGGGDVQLSAGNDLRITGAQQYQEELHQKVVKTSGLLGNGVGFAIGTRTTKDTTDSGSLTNVGSTVGSVEGNVDIQAGGDALIQGSDIIGKEQVSIVGKNVTIESLFDEQTARTSKEVEQSGFGMSLSSPTVTATLSAYDSLQKAGRAKSTDKRLEALYALRASRTALEAGKGLADAGYDPTSGLSLDVGYSRSGSKMESTVDATMARGSRIMSDGDVSITATGDPEQGKGDLTIAGSAIQGVNVSLSANRDLSLISAANTLQSHGSSSSYSFSAGLSLGIGSGGGGLGLSAKGSLEDGGENGQDVTHTETTVTASGRLSLTSGRDATLRGAVASGDSIVASIGRNLSIESEQDTSTYHSENRSVSGQVGVNIIGGGASASLSANYGKTDSNYRSVQEQSGLFAGANGFDITVGGNTDLKGAVIASSASEDKNILRTTTLTKSDIENVSEYTSFSAGGTLGTGGFKPSAGMPAHDSKTSTTLSAVSPATIITPSDISSLSRDTANAQNSIGNIFDKKAVAERQELASVFGEEAFKAVGDIGKALTDPYTSAQLKEKQAEVYLLLKANESNLDVVQAAALRQMEADGFTTQSATDQINQALADEQQYQGQYDFWKDGGIGKILLHAGAGATQVALGGGNAVSGAIGAGASEALSSVTMDLPRSVQPLASLAIGATAATLTGDGWNALSGGVSALYGEEFNRQLHKEEIAKIKELAKGYKGATCGDHPCASEEEYELRLVAAACYMVQCADGIPDGNANKAGWAKLQEVGAGLLPEIAQLAYSSGADVAWGAYDARRKKAFDELYWYGSTSISPDHLFEYSTSDAIGDVVSENALLARLSGGLQLVSGAFETAAGGAACDSGFGCLVGGGLFVNGIDNAWTGAKKVVTGDPYTTMLNTFMRDTLGMSPEWADTAESYFNIATTVASTKVMTGQPAPIGELELSPRSWTAEDLKGINPGRELGIPGCTTNCFNTAVATDRYLAGELEVSALPATKGVSIAEASDRLGLQFPHLNLETIESEMLQAGPGARGLVAGYYENGDVATGHWFNVAVSKAGELGEAEISFLDGQWAEVLEPRGKWSNYFFARTDGLVLPAGVDPATNALLIPSNGLGATAFPKDVWSFGLLDNASLNLDVLLSPMPQIGTTLLQSNAAPAVPPPPKTTDVSRPTLGVSGTYTP